MSHFLVGVMTKADPETNDQEIANLLAPYDEQTDNSDYLEFTVNPNPNDDDELDPVTRQYGWWENPNARWDWYEIGCRFWRDKLKTYSGKRVNAARIKAIDLSPDPELYRSAERYWEVVVEHAPLAPDEDADSYIQSYKPEYFHDRYASKHDFALEEASLALMALVTPQGDWLEPGRMGWFGADDSTRSSKAAFQKRVKELLAANPEAYLTLVNCHI